MKTLRSAALLSLLACCAALAQRFELSVLSGIPRISDAPLGSLSEQEAQDDDTRLEGRQSYGVRFTINTPGYYGHEFGYIQSRATLSSIFRTGTDASIVTRREDRITIQQASYNFLIYFMPRGERWRPYMTGGLQAHQYGAPNFPEWTRGSSRHYGANYGLGLKLKLFQNALIRLDFRDYFGGKPYDLTFEDVTRSGGILRQMEGSVGIAITF